MTIFVTLNERFKAPLQTQCLSTFKDNLNSALCSPLKQTFIGREFEVKGIFLYRYVNLCYNVH